jgi:uncharacterized protein (TIGR00251 family)
MIGFKVRDQSVTFAVRVQPRAARSSIDGEMDGALKVRLTAPPVDGAANEELIRLLARLFEIPRASVAIVSGTSSRRKLVRLSGLDASRFSAALESALSPDNR